MWVSRSPPSHVSLLALRTAVWVGGWGLSSNLISHVVPLHLTLHLCAELLSNTVPLCLLLHCLSSGCFPRIESDDWKITLALDSQSLSHSPRVKSNRVSLPESIRMTFLDLASPKEKKPLTYSHTHDLHASLHTHTESRTPHTRRPCSIMV